MILYQGVYNPYAGRQYLQIYGVPGSVNTGVYSYGQLGHSLSGSHGYSAVQSYGLPGQYMMQFGGPNANGASTTAIPAIQAPYPTGIYLHCLTSFLVI